MPEPWSHEIGSHLQRVSCYSALMAGALGLEPELVRVASRLHDVGMVAVTDGILLKPGPLTPEERREMQDHTSLGRAMLAGSGTELLDTASAIAWSHHERFDGGGYPCGLRRRADPAGGPDHRGGGRVRRDHHRPRLPARAAGGARGRDPARRARAPVRPGGRRRVPRLARAGAGDPRALRPGAGELSAARAVERTRRSRCRRRPARSRSRRAGCGGGPTKAGSSRSAPPAGIAASRSRPSGGSPPSAACSRACGRSSRPASRCRSSRSSSQRQGRQVAAAAAAAIYREGPPGWFASETAGPDLRDWLTAMAESSASGRYAGALRPPRR